MLPCVRVVRISLFRAVPGGIQCAIGRPDVPPRGTCNPRRSRSTQGADADALPNSSKVLLNPANGTVCGTAGESAPRNTLRRVRCRSVVIWRFAAVWLNRRVEEEPIIERATRRLSDVEVGRRGRTVCTHDICSTIRIAANAALPVDGHCQRPLAGIWRRILREATADDDA